MSDSVRPHRRQPTRLPRPWDSPRKNTGVGCHFLLQFCLTELVTNFSSLFQYSSVFVLFLSPKHLFLKKERTFGNKRGYMKEQVSQEDKQVRVLDLLSASRSVRWPTRAPVAAAVQKSWGHRPAVFTSSKQTGSCTWEEDRKCLRSGRGSWKGICRKQGVQWSEVWAWGWTTEALRLRFLPWGLWHAHHHGSPDLTPFLRRVITCVLKLWRGNTSHHP